MDVVFGQPAREPDDLSDLLEDAPAPVTGTSQLVVDERRRVIVGATFTGPGVQELLRPATVAIAGEVTVDRLWHAVPSFPTVSEVWLHLLEAYGL